MGILSQIQRLLVFHSFSWTSSLRIAISPIYGKSCAQDFKFRMALTKMFQGDQNIQKIFAGTYTFGPRREIHVLSNFDVKKFAIQKILVCVKHLWSRSYWIK